MRKLSFKLKLCDLEKFIAAPRFLTVPRQTSKCGKSPKNNVALAWFKNNNEIIHFDPTSGLLLEDKDSNKRTFNNSSGWVSGLRSR